MKSSICRTSLRCSSVGGAHPAPSSRLDLRTTPRFHGLALLCAVVIAQSGGNAHADRWRFAADLELDIRYQRFAEPAPGVERNDSVLAGFTAGGFAGKRTLGYVAAVDVRLGAGVYGGFAYDFALRVLGVGLAFGPRVRLSTTTGIGAHGHTGHIPAAMRFPFRATLHIDLGRRVHLSGFAQTTFVSFAEVREQGSDTAPFGDELSAGGYLRLGKGGTQYSRTHWGNGYFLGAAYQEMLGERQLVFTLGYGISMVSD